MYLKKPGLVDRLVLCLFGFSLGGGGEQVTTLGFGFHFRFAFSQVEEKLCF